MSNKRFENKEMTQSNEYSTIRQYTIIQLIYYVQMYTYIIECMLNVQLPLLQAYEVNI